MESLIIDCSTGEEQRIALTVDQIKVKEQELKDSSAQALAFETDRIAKEAALAKLAALGLTTDDLKALGLGGN